MKIYDRKYTAWLVVLLLFACFLPADAQHRGDNLAYQGFRVQNESSVRAMGMGSAYSSISDGLNSMFYNPAGLFGIEGIEVSISANMYQRDWWENQVYRPNRYFVTLPFYLEKLYIPDPAANGIWDHEVFQDTSFAYNVAQPEMGNDPLSKEAAEWTRDISGSGINSIILGAPFKVINRQFIFALAYNRQYDLEDYDRNDTYLSPHIGYRGYGGFTETATGTDTINVDWFEYLRQRSGTMHNIRTALAYKVSKSVNVGLAVNYKSGESDDVQLLDKVGYFGLFDENEFFFSYDTVVNQVAGTSEFKSMNADIGLIYTISRFSLGINITSPYTITRDWKYNITHTDSNGVSSENLSGQDKFEIPAAYRFGISFQPADRFTFSFDYGLSPYSNAKFKPARTDSTFRNWPDQETINFGIRFRATSFLDLLAGYRSISQTFIPDGAAFDGKGPRAKSWTLGAGIELNAFGRIDFAYELRDLNYRDAYFSNTNYAVEKFNNLAVAYTFKF